MSYPFRPVRHVFWPVLLIFLAGFSVAPSHADLWGISVDPYGTAAPGTEANYNRVFRFDNAGNKLPDDISSHSAGLTYPTGIATGPNDTIYVSSQATGSILWYDAQTGDPLPSPQPEGPVGLFASLDTAAPAQLAFGPDGNLYVSEFFGTSVRVYDSTTGARLADAATGLTSAGGLTFAANGDLLIGDGFAMAPGQSARIVRVHEGVQSTFGVTDMGVVYAPTGLLTLADGDLLVVDLLANQILRFDENGQNPSQFAVIPPEIPDPLPPGANSPSNNPSDVAFDPDGNLIVAMLGLTTPPDDRGALLRYDLDGNLLEIIADQLEPIGGIDWTPAAETLSGDFDADQFVGQSDFEKWSADFGKLVARGNGADGNGNGIVDAADYLVWRKAAALGTESTLAFGVPEPSSVVLLPMGAALVLSARRRKRCSSSSRG